MCLLLCVILPLKSQWNESLIVVCYIRINREYNVSGYCSPQQADVPIQQTKVRMVVKKKKKCDFQDKYSSPLRNPGAKNFCNNDLALKKRRVIQRSNGCFYTSFISNANNTIKMMFGTNLQTMKNQFHRIGSAYVHADYRGLLQSYTYFRKFIWKETFFWANGNSNFP